MGIICGHFVDSLVPAKTGADSMTDNCHSENATGVKAMQKHKNKNNARGVKAMQKHKNTNEVSIVISNLKVLHKSTS
jgi:hypothetical protein